MNPETKSPEAAGGPSEGQVLEALSGVIDPEVGINIVDLGLIYKTDIQGGRVHITMTMTTSTCPLHAYIAEMARKAVQAKVPGAQSVDVEMVWDPPWTPDMMTEAARKQMGR